MSVLYSSIVVEKGVSVTPAYKKLERKNMDLDKIHDIVALRVILPTIEDCYKALGVIHSKWR